MNVYRRFYIPARSPALEANLDELSSQGWELVCCIAADQQQVEAIFRREATDRPSEVAP